MALHATHAGLLSPSHADTTYLPAWPLLPQSLPRPRSVLGLGVTATTRKGCCFQKPVACSKVGQGTEHRTAEAGDSPRGLRRDTLTWHSQGSPVERWGGLRTADLGVPRATGSCYPLCVSTLGGSTWDIPLESMQLMMTRKFRPLTRHLIPELKCPRAPVRHRTQGMKEHTAGHAGAFLNPGGTGCQQHLLRQESESGMEQSRSRGRWVLPRRLQVTFSVGVDKQPGHGPKPYLSSEAP